MNEFQRKLIAGLGSMKDLYNEVNTTVILHEYITGSFYFKALIEFRTFYDKLFETYAKGELQNLEGDLEYLNGLLNKAGHGTLYSILYYVFSRISNVKSLFDHNVLQSITDNYDQVKLLLRDAEAYITQYESNESEVEQRPFKESLKKFEDIPKFYDQIKNRTHLLKKLQKENDSKKRFSMYNSNFHNLVIGVFSAALTFLITKNTTKEHYSCVQEKRAEQEVEPAIIEPVEDSEFKAFPETDAINSEVEDSSAFN